MKICGTCLQNKLKEQFPRTSTLSYSKDCRDCINAKQREKARLKKLSINNKSDE